MNLSGIGSMFGKMFGGGGGGGGPLGMIGGLFGGGGGGPLGMIGNLLGGGGPLGIIGNLLGGLGGQGGFGGQQQQNPMGFLGQITDAFGGPDMQTLFAQSQQLQKAQQPLQQMMQLPFAGAAPQAPAFPANYFENTFEPAAGARPAAGGAAPVGRTRGGEGAATTDVLQRAARQAGVPESWANSPALARLIEKESNGRVDAKNPNSTAFGIFQFLKGTWGEYLPEVPYGTKDAYWQSVGGLRYIKDRYGSPEKALDFHNRNNWY